MAIAILGLLGLTIEYNNVYADAPKSSTSVARPQGGPYDLILTAPDVASTGPVTITVEVFNGTSDTIWFYGSVSSGRQFSQWPTVTGASEIIGAECNASSCIDVWRGAVSAYQVVTYSIHSNGQTLQYYPLIDVDFTVGSARFTQTKSIAITSSETPTLTPTPIVPSGTLTATPTNTSTPTATNTQATNPTSSATATASAIGVQDVRVSNVTDSSFTVSFLTKSSSIDESIATLAYWVSGNISTTRIATDFHPFGHTHWFQVNGLSSNTEYQYAITLETQTGVYRGVVRTKSTINLSTPNPAYGQVTTMAGVPVEGALIYAKREDQEGWLSTVTSREGYWSLDLNNFHESSTMTVRASAVSQMGGYMIYVEVVDSSSREAHVTVNNGFAWPLNLVVLPVVERVVSFSAGWNTFALPLETIHMDNVADLAELLNGDGTNRMSAVARYVNGAWESSIISGTTVMGQNPFLLLGEGYFVKMNQSYDWKVRGYEPSQGTLPLHLQRGWNLVAVPTPVGLKASDLTDRSGVISGTTTYNVDVVSDWSDGAYKSHVAGFPHNDFQIDSRRGYFLRARSSGMLIPGRDGYQLP